MLTRSTTPGFAWFWRIQYSTVYAYQIHQTPPAAFVGFSTTLCIAKPWMLCICHCTKSIKLHRLLLLDSGLCIAKPWMLCICYCTNSINWVTFLLHVDEFGMVSRKNAEGVRINIRQMDVCPYGFFPTPVKAVCLYHVKHGRSFSWDQLCSSPPVLSNV